MRVAALYDIHGNLPALEAVLQDVECANVDLILVGGDVVNGPMPRETLECLLDLSLPVHFIRGNGDREVASENMDFLPESIREITRWTAEQLTREQRQRLDRWPETLRLEVNGLGHVLFCHATPRSDEEMFTRLTPENRLLPVFAYLDVPLVVCGHTHMQFDRTVGATRIVNAGSVGMPYGEPGAYWLLLGPDTEFRRTEYDRTKAAERIQATTYPQAQDFADNNVLSPPTETEALEVFTKREA